jgi:WD40 repeat protein
MLKRRFRSLYALFLTSSILSLAQHLPADDGLPPGTVALRGHKEAVYAVAFTPDGKHALTGSGDPSVKVWEVATGKEVKTFAGPKGHRGLILGVAVSPDGTHFATAGADNSARVWDFPDSRPVREYALRAEGQAVAVSPDGSRAAGAGKDGTIRVWATADGKQLYECCGHSGAVTGLAFSPNGQLLASVGADSTLRYWKAGDGKPLASFAAHPGAGVAFHPNGALAITCGPDGSVRCWGLPPVATRGLQAPFKDPVTALWLSPDGAHLVAAAGKSIRLAAFANGQAIKEFAAADSVTSVAASAGGALLAAAAGAEVLLWQTKDGKQLMRQAAHAGEVTGVAFAPNGSQLATVGKDGMLRLSAVPGGTKAAFEAHKGGCTAVAFHDNGTQALTAGADGSVKLWALPAGKLVRTYGPMAAGVDSLAFARGCTQLAATSGKTLTMWNAADGKEAFSLPMPARARGVSFSGDRTRLATAGEDGRVRVWDIATRRELQGFLHAAAATGVAFHPHAANQLVSAGADGAVGVHTVSALRTAALGPAVNGVAVSPTTGQVIAACADGKVRLTNAATGAVERVLDAGDRPVSCVAVARNGVLVAAGGADRKVRLFAANDGRPLSAFTMPAEPRALAFSPNNAALVATGDDGSVTAWDVAYNPGQAPPADFGKVVQSYRHPGAAGVVFPAAGSVFYTSGADKSVKAWRLASEAPLRNFGHPNTVNAIAYNKEGTLLATGCGDGKLRLFDPAKGAQVREINARPLPNNEGAVYAVAFSPDGKQVASASKDQSVKLFNVADGKLLREFKAFKEKESPRGHQDAVLCVAFSPDGKRLASGGADRTIKVWNVEDGAVAAEMANPAFKAASHPGWVYALRFVDGGKKVISAGAAPRLRGYVAAWEAASGKPLWGKELDAGTIFALAASADEALLALGTGGSVRSERDLNLGLLLKMPR